MAEGGSILCCHPLDYRTAKTGGAVNGGAFAPFILTVDRLGWIYYCSSIIITQSEPVLSPVATRASQRYAPKGGSYTDLKNGWITSLTCVVYQTYLPRDNVDTWISDHNDGMSDYIVGLVASLGLAQADKIAAKVLSKYGISISISAIAAIAEGVIFTLDWMNYQQVITASDSGKNGILIEYLTNIGSGNARVYSSWTSSYVPMKPYGGDATWHAGDYYVMP